MGERRAHLLADAPDEGHRLGRQESRGLALAQHGKSARLVEVGRELGQELVLRQADRHRDADLVLDRAREAGERTGGRAAVQPLGAGEIEEGLVDRQRLDQRREIEHQGAHLAADADVFRHVGRHDGGVRAQPAGLEHRHRRFHPEGAGDIAGGRHHAAPPAADDHRLVVQGGIVALLDRRIEGVAIHMRDGEPVDLGMPRHARRAAARTA